MTPAGLPPGVGINRPFWEVAHRLVLLVSWTVFRLRRRGAEHARVPGGVLIVSNHISNKDPVLVGAGVLPRQTYFMAKIELFRVPVLRRMIRALGAFPVRRGESDRDAIRAARAVLAAGEAVIMFPEGTRSRDGQLRAAFPGAGLLALEPGITVIPAAIWGSQRRLGPVRIVYGPPVDLSGIGAESKSGRAQEATRRVMAAIAELVPLAGGPPQVVPEGAPSTPAHERGEDGGDVR